MVERLTVRTRFHDIHERVIRGDELAVAQLAREVSPLLQRRLRRVFLNASTYLLIDSAHDAICVYLQRPGMFDGGRGVPLDAFLCGIAARILRDRLRAEQRRHARESMYAEHVVSAFRSVAADHHSTRVVIQAVRRTLPRVCDPTELAAITAWLDEDDTREVAVCLGISHLQRTEQRRQVRRFISRVVKRLQRLLAEGT